MKRALMHVSPALSRLMIASMCVARTSAVILPSVLSAFSL